MRDISWQDLQEIQELKAQYFFWMDNKQWKRLRGVFSDTCTYEAFPFGMDGPDHWVSSISTFFSDTVTQHRGTNPRFRQIADDRVRGVWAMTDYVTWPPDSRTYRDVEIAGMYGFQGYGYYEEEYVRTVAGWRIDFMRLTRVRIDPLINLTVATPAYDTPSPTLDWLNGA